MKYCPHCGNSVREKANFCPSCGNALVETSHAQSVSDSNNQFKEIYNNATAKLNHYTGEEGAVKVNIVALFSEVFKHHTKILFLLQGLRRLHLLCRMFQMNGQSHGYFREFC